jgi:hypothetical protein
MATTRTGCGWPFDQDSPAGLDRPSPTDEPGHDGQFRDRRTREFFRPRTRLDAAEESFDGNTEAKVHVGDDPAG